ncbi:MAG: sensor histidine kinase [Gammaproteobacteria bacterium]|nr:MAG: sensor histidine kinase [Gammaproteobacteria bacterium]
MEKRSTIRDQGFLPNFCDVTTVFMLILLVELFALVLALASVDASHFWDRLAMISLFTQWLALIIAGLLCLLRKPLNQLKTGQAAIASFTLMMIVTLIISLIIMSYGQHLGFSDFTQPYWADYFLLRNLAIAAVIYAVVLRYFYIQQQWVLNMQAQSLAQIQALKARIRPHFLFNSMNTIASLISLDAAKAEKAVEDLSDLFRASLQENPHHSLADEIALTRSYVDIEQLRLGDRLRVEWQLDDLPDMELPALCLQPLVENAIYHGIEPLPQGGVIKIQAHIANNQLCLSVINPIDKSGRMKISKGNHMAQSNIKTRLALLYGDAASFIINEDMEQYCVTLRIPVIVPEP